LLLFGGGDEYTVELRTINGGQLVKGNHVQVADGQADPALATLLAAVREGPGETRDQARALMLDVFRMLGDDHPLTIRYRRDLARALF
ncbi:MAG TPA: tetratricopeptide repeat protein, partial [Actinomycetota bacterium]|nr:tetratricopeptide repeat protein [Actinomycetota bacterium]